MAAFSEGHRYPDAEHYVFPRNAAEQGYDELRLYPDPIDFRQNLVTLRRIYGQTALLQCMQRYAVFAPMPAQYDTDADSSIYDVNGDFFSGALMGVHLNVAPLPTSRKYPVLSHTPLPDLSETVNATEVETSIRDWLKMWVGDEDAEHTWHQFMDEQTEEFQDVAMEVTSRMYEDWTETLERELDFMAGLALATSIIEDAPGFKRSLRP